MSGAVTKIARPAQMRGLLYSQIKKNLIIASGLCVLTVAAEKVLINDPRKAKYAEFYKNYDPEREFQKMKKAGIFASCGPDD